MYREEFKDIKGYEGYYQVSNAGRVKSLKRKAKHSSGNGYITIKEKILKSQFIGHKYKQYLAVGLYKDRKEKMYRIHQLVMNAFKPNPDPKHFTEIDHIRNGDIFCNFVTSLEWVTRSENQRRRFRRDNGKSPKPLKGLSGIKTVLQFDLNNNFLIEFESMREAERITGINHGNISKCCQGKYKSVSGYIWKYKIFKGEKN